MDHDHNFKHLILDYPHPKHDQHTTKNPLDIIQ